jgi:hypothetical protein
VLVIDVVRFGAPRAYIAPHGMNESNQYSVMVDQPDGGFELSPAFDTLSDAVTWALERTDFVIARGSTGPYYWYGRGPMPPDISAPST